MNIQSELSKLAPVLTNQQVDSYEKNNDINIMRRVTFLTATKSGQELFEIAIDEEKTEVFVEMLEMANEYISYLEATIGIVQCAQARLCLIADCYLKYNKKHKKGTSKH